ncbi:restriction endonuclease subunit S [Clostridium sp. AF32-12BH]|uniref:restriction endonuclease subunit S n=1 Tax=Clostridium sp. AF32-12BH TaxID=2292006 RepID=UPI001A9BBF43|nr:restriction endonuclease subunit S [Clostridium sp. AF32-12BH]
MADIAELTVGYVGNMAKQYKDKGVKFLRSLNIKPFHIVEDDLKYISKEFCESLKKSILHENDLIIVRTGLPGTCCVVPKDYEGSNCADVVLVRPNLKLVNSHYLAAYINVWGKKQVENNKVGAIQKHFNVKAAEEMLIDLPDLETQNRVAKIICDLNDKIMNNEKVNDYLEQQALLIFRHMFQNISYGLNHVGDYITPRRGTALLSKDAIPGCIPVIAGGLVPATYHNVANTIAPVLTISGSGANAGYINIWHDSVWSSDSSYIDYGMTTNVYFWYAFLKLRQQDIFDIQTGSAQPHIYPKHIAELSIGNLDKANVKTYTSKVTPLFTRAGANIRENIELKRLRDWLLPMLMNGQATIED